MRFMKPTRIILGIIPVVLILGMFIARPAGAQASGADAAQGIQISPATVDINMSRGGTYNIPIRVRNTTNSSLVYTESVDDFNSSGETGSPHVFVDNTLPPTASIRTWVDAIPQFTLSKQELKIIDVQVTVPDNAEPGGHYGVIRFSGATPKVEGTGVGLSASAGVLILIRVDGAIIEKASLASFYTAQNDKQSFFFESSSAKDPITFVTRIQNEGNIHIKPFGTIELRDMFGGLVKSMKVGDDESNVLPKSIRRFESTYNNPWMVGLYTANLAIGYGSTGQAITRSITFWVIPYKAILAGLLILATIVFILIKMIKAYNRHIIEKYGNENQTKNKKHNKKKG